MFKKLSNNLAWLIIGIVLAIAGTVYAANQTIPQSTRKGDTPCGQAAGYYNLLHPGTDGQVLIASSTSPCGLTFATGGGGSATTTINGMTPSNGIFLFQSGNPSLTISTTSPANVVLTVATTTVQSLITGTSPINVSSGVVSLQSNLGSNNYWTSGFLNASTSQFTNSTVTGNLNLTGYQSISGNNSNAGAGAISAPNALINTSLSNGLDIQGAGQTYDFILYNQAGNTVFYVGGSSQNVHFQGAIYDANLGNCSNGVIGSSGLITCNGSPFLTSVNLATNVSGVLPVANGGTGQSILTANDILFGNDTSGVASSSQLYFVNNTLNSSTTFETALTAVTATATNLSVTSLTSGNCVQAAGGGLLTTAATPCGSGGGLSTIGSGASSTVALWTNSSNTLTTSPLSYSGGNMTIGSTTPGGLFVLQGTAGVANDVFDVASSTNSNILRVLSTGGTVLPLNASSTQSSTSNGSTVPVLQLGSTALTSPSANGTVLAIANLSSFTGDVIDIQNNNKKVFTISGETVNVGNNNGGASGTNTAGLSITGGLLAANLASIAQFGDYFGNVVVNGSNTTNYGYEFGGTIQGQTTLGTMDFDRIDPTIFNIGNRYMNATALDVAPQFKPGFSSDQGQWIAENIEPAFGNGLTDYILNATASPIGLQIAPTLNYSPTSTAGYIALKIASVETSVPTSTAINYLIQAGTSTNTSMFVLTNQGNVGIGTTTPYSALTVNGSLQQSTEKSCSTGLTTDANGTINGCVVSDQRLKKEISDLTFNPNILNEINPVTYYWKNTAQGTQQHAGFVAQQVKPYLPQAVVSAGNGYFGIDPLAMIGYLWKYTQVFSKQMDDFMTSTVLRFNKDETTINKQQAEINNLQRQVNLLLKEQTKGK